MGEIGEMVRKKTRKGILLLAVCAMILGSCFSAAYAEDSAGMNGAASDTEADTGYPAGDPEEVAAVILHTNDVHVGYQDNIGYDGLALYGRGKTDRSRCGDRRTFS